MLAVATCAWIENQVRSNNATQRHVTPGHYTIATLLLRFYEKPTKITCVTQYHAVYMYVTVKE